MTSGADLEKLKIRWKNLSGNDDVEEEKQDLIKRLNLFIEVAKETEESFRDEIEDEKKLEEDKRNLLRYAASVQEFVFIYEAKKGLRENSTENITVWWAPLKDKAKTTVKDLGTAARDKRNQVSERKRTEQAAAAEADRERADAKAQAAADRVERIRLEEKHEKQQQKFANDAAIAVVAYDLAFNEAKKSIAGALSIADFTTEVAEDLEFLDAAKECQQTACGYSSNIFESKRKLDGEVENTLQAELNDRMEKCSAIANELAEARIVCFKKRTVRWKDSPEERDRGLRHGYEASSETKTDSDFHKRRSSSPSGSTTSGAFSNIKTEKVEFPNFKEENESRAVQDFPVWKKSWEALIGLYPPDHQALMLRKHIGKQQARHIDGVEDDYTESMRRLTLHYGDPDRYVRVVLSDIEEFLYIKPGNYSQCVTYSQLLQAAAKKLKILGKSGELSNSSTIRQIMNKFDPRIREDWARKLQTLDPLCDQLVELIKWLEEVQIPTWKKLSSWEDSSKKAVKPDPVKPGKGGAGREVGAGTSTKEVKKGKGGCYHCGSKEHLSRDCEKRKALQCSQCNKNGHLIKDCYMLHPEKIPERFKNKRRFGGGGSPDGGSPPNKLQVKRFRCASCRHPQGDHDTVDCDFIKKNMGRDSGFRADLIKHNHDCPRCLGDHEVSKCPVSKANCGCSKNHDTHRFSCKDVSYSTQARCNDGSRSPGSGKPSSVLELMKCPSADSTIRQEIGVFWDSGSTSNFIREDTAQEFGFGGRPVQVTMLTMDGETTREYIKYNCKMKNLCGQMRHFTALGVPSILDEIDEIDPQTVEKLFPHMKSWNEVFDCLRPTSVDVLIGQDRKSWQPDKFARSVNGGDLWVMSNEMGQCIGGQHPQMGHVGVKWSGEDCSSGFYTQTYNCFKVEILSEEYLDTPLESDYHELEYCGKRIIKADSDMKYLLEDFQRSEGLMVDNRQECGNCSCKNCPLPGAEHSLQGELDLKRIKDCLTYNRSERRWYADLPWLPGHSANDLPETEKISEKLMLQSEKSLSKNDDWKETYNQQIKELIERGGARVVSEKELEDHKKTGKRIYYLSHLAVQQPGKTTPVRWCLDPSRKLLGGYSPNDILTVGPSTHVNNLAAILLSFRCGRKHMVSVCDIRKMHQRVGLNKDSAMMQLIKWRFCDENKDIQTIAITCNTFGFVCANSIATSGLHSTTTEVFNICTQQILSRYEGVSGDVPSIGFIPEPELFLRGTKSEDFMHNETKEDNPDGKLGITEEMKEGEDRYPFNSGLTMDDLEDFSDQDILDMWLEAYNICKNLSYIDDLIAAFKSKRRQKVVKYLVDVILDRCGMPSKGWLDAESCKEDEVVELGGEKIDKTLGMSWMVKSDVFVFRISVKFSGKSSKKSHEARKWTVQELSDNPPPILTRRMVLRETARVFDPLGLICPALAEAKFLIRESWNGLTVPQWDDPLEESQRIRWIKWFVDIHELEKLIISRSCVPEGEFIGDPDLVSLADGSPQAFGAALYLVYSMLDGTFWSSLLCARSKIARRGHNSIPRTELSGSCVAQRLKKFIKNKTNIKVNRCFHLVDSSTVLHWVNVKGDKKNIGVFEGIRIAEILEQNVPKDNGNLTGWGHIDRKHNSADLTTRATPVSQVQSDFWLRGPSFLYSLPVEDWPVNWDFVELKKKVEKDEDLSYHVDFTENLNQVQTIEDASNPEADGVIGVNVINWIKDYLTNYSDLNKILRLISWFLLFLSRLATIRSHLKDERVLRNRLASRKTVLVLHQVRSKEDNERAIRVWIRTFQYEIKEEIEKELLRGDVLKSEKKKKFKRSKYSRLSLFKDSDGIFRVGSRLRWVTTITESGQMPALMPSYSRSHFLQMKLSHDIEHSGDDRTLLRFCRDGYFALGSMKVARKVRLDCSFCQGHGGELRCFQKMGDLDADLLQCDTPWSYLQIDLFGPFKVVENRKNLKRWGLMAVDVVSGAVYADITEDYSTASVLMCLDRFQSYYGWPKLISSDPGSQLESASGKIEEWWDLMGKDLLRLAGEKGFKWNVSPANSPWYQGRVEKKIGLLKKLLLQAVGDTKLSTLALLTSIRQCVFLLNSRPMNVNPKVNRDGFYQIVTPNDLLLGRNNGFLDMSELSDQLKDSPVTRNLQLIAQVKKKFYDDVSTKVFPKYFIRQKWHYETAPMPEINDVVRIHDNSQFKNHWKMAIVKEVHPSRDGKVRSFTLEYVILREKMKPRRVEVTRSSQRLSLLAKAEHFGELVDVEQSENYPEVSLKIVPRDVNI